MGIASLKQEHVYVSVLFFTPMYTESKHHSSLQKLYDRAAPHNKCRI